MKKVLFSIGKIAGGGAERVVSVWTHQLAEAGFEVSLLLYGRCEAEYAIDSRVKVLTVVEKYEDCQKMGYVERLKEMRRLIREVAPDTIINFLPRMQIWMMMASFGIKVRRVETVRVSPWHIGIGNKMEMCLWKTCFRRADAVIFQTAEQGEFFSTRIRKKGVVIPNPISKQYVDAPKIAYSDTVRHFVAAGRITSQKNYPVMIEAFSLALQKEPSLTLSIYGTGDEAYMQRLQAMIDEKDVGDSIRLMGRTADMLSVLQQADAYLMTSDFEGMPNALAEAMATGLPCISTDCRTGPRDLIDDGQNGFLVKTGDKDSIFAAIVKLAQMDRKAAESIGQQARNKILEFCSEENSLARLIQVIEGESRS